jgi:hypothetical protein
MGFSFNQRGEMIGRYALGADGERNEDRTITIFSPGTAHAVLKAALEKIGNDQLKAVLASQIEPEGPSR